MKRVILSVLMMVVTQATLWAGAFTSGNLVILRVGNGTEALTNAGDSLFLDEYTTNGGFVQSVAAPTNQFIGTGGAINYPIALTGGNVSEGQISLSTDGRYVSIVGFATNHDWVTSNGGNISGAAGNAIPRVVARADANGNFDTSTAIINDLTSGSGIDVRGIASTDGSNFWIASSAAGVAYTTLGSNGAIRVQGATNKRTIGIFNPNPFTVFPPGHQQVYNTSAGGVFASGTNFPMVTGPEIGLTNIVGSGGALVSTYGFIALRLQDGVSSNIDTVYVCDDGTVTGGISKWTYNPAISNLWFETGSISSLAGPNAISTNGTGGARQLTGTVTVSGTQTSVTLYVTAAANTGTIFGNLYKIVDNSGFGGTLSGLLPAPIATAPANTLWRGVAFAPAETLRITSISKSGGDVPLTWAARGGRSYVVQSTLGDVNGNYTSSSFADIGPTNFTLGFGPTQNSFTDIDGVTNKPSRYYRVKLLPEP